MTLSQTLAYLARRRAIESYGPPPFDTVKEGPYVGQIILRPEQQAQVDADDFWDRYNAFVEKRNARL